MSKKRTIQFRIHGTIPSKKNNQQIVKNISTKKQYIVPSYRYTNWNKKILIELTKQADEISKRRGVTFPITGIRITKKMNLTNKMVKELIKSIPTISIKFYFQDFISRDLTNKAESIHDTLKNAKIIMDDSQFNLGTVTLSFDISTTHDNYADIYLSFVE